MKGLGFIDQHDSFFFFLDLFALEKEHTWGWGARGRRGLESQAHLQMSTSPMQPDFMTLRS